MNSQADMPSFWAGMFIAILLILALIAISQPNCPSEDSCYVNYSHGRWSIIEGER